MKRVTELWEALGGRVTVLDPMSHDRAVAAISHLPHLVADALVDAVVRLDPSFLDVAARGFKDTTRIAASDPRVWREIFQENRDGARRGARRLPAGARPSRRARRRAAMLPRIEAELDRIRRVRDELAMTISATPLERRHRAVAAL